MSEVRVTTGSRLHFGLLRLPPSPNWRDDGTRYFGGAGLMIDEPGVVVRIERATEWVATGALGDRALAAARRFAIATAPDDCFAVHVERAPPEHVGLGTGTQLELAVATGVSRALGRADDPVTLAHPLGRGRRSAIGVRGFAQGGFLIDRGKRRPDEIAEVERLKFPADWRILLITPDVASSWHGDRERAALAAVGARASSQLENLLVESLVPALTGRNFAAFGAALSDYNAQAGEYYREFQGGKFADPVIENLVECLRECGAAAGQSSWGPTIFAMTESESKALAVSAAIHKTGGARAGCRIVRGRNTGATVGAK